MFEILHAFGAGIAFAFGIILGGVLSSLATRHGRDDFKKELMEHQKKVEDRLQLYAINSTRIAEALEYAVKSKD